MFYLFHWNIDNRRLFQGLLFRTQRNRQRLGRNIVRVSFFLILRHTQIDSSTINGNVEFVHLVQLYFHVTSVNSVFVSDKIINNYDNFRIKSLSYSEISAILCSVFSVLTFFSLILEYMSTNVRKFRFSLYIWH